MSFGGPDATHPQHSRRGTKHSDGLPGILRPRSAQFVMRKRNTFSAISVYQPWADLIVRGIKDIEKRSWPTRFRGRILIHAGGVIKWDVVKEHRRSLGLDSVDDYEPHAMAIVGMAEIVDCVTTHRSRFFLGPYGFVLKNAVRFRKPIRYRGRQRIFRVPLGRLRGTQAIRVKPGEFVA